MIDERILKAAPFDISNSIVFAANVGSHSHGTYIPKEDEAGIDDVDIIGALMPPVEAIIGFSTFDHWTQFVDELDLVFYSYRKLVNLWMKCNPNVLGTLWLEDRFILASSPMFEEFRENRHLFVCSRVGSSFGGYAFSQLKRIQKNRHEGYMGEKRKVLVEKFGYDVKHAAHLIRLLRMGTEFFDDGNLHVFRTHDAEQLKDIKRGLWTLEEVQELAADLFDQLETKSNNSSFPTEPDGIIIERILIRHMKEHICGNR